nr:protein disulfide-isomerase-like [Tanacetum cinerariifolium]
MNRLLCKFVEELEPENGGRDFHYYAGPRDAYGLVTTLERLIREEFENFSAVANQVLWESWDYDFFHTTDATLLHRGESPITVPTLRLLKPYDELFVDSQ